MRLRSLLACAALAAGAVFYTPDAEACGGCFPPPGEQSSVVTDHRMILSVSKAQSTLYDQIRYSGAPSEFAWILPISGEVDVGLSADSLFGGLDNLTSVVVQPPPANCPPYPESCRRHDLEEKGASAGGEEPTGALYDAGVSVIKTEVVGPYETVQLHPTSENDTAALTQWLTDHQFSVPDDIKPVIAQYVKEHFNFLALRLVPGKGVSSMRPVRVTTQGANVALPLRMVAAGTGATVGITLWVVAEGRYQPSNFNSFSILDDELTWDWATSTSNFKTVREQKQAADPGKLWEIESSLSVSTQQIQNAARFQGGFSGTAGGDYLEAKDPQTQQTKTAAEVQTEDFDTLFAGFGSADTYRQVRVTRLRADLAHAALATDLTVAASTDQGQLARTRQPKHESGQPLCPVYQECTQTGQLPRDEAIKANAANAGSSEGDGCTTTKRGGDAGLSLLLGFVAVAVGRSVRHRRRQR
jgi:hypothetical protein